MLQNYLGINVPGWGAVRSWPVQLRHQRLWDSPWLWRFPLSGPWAASTMSVLIVHWHCQRLGTDLIPPFSPFLLLAVIFVSLFSLCPRWIRLLFCATEMQQSSLKAVNFWPQTQKPMTWRLRQQNDSKPEAHLKILKKNLSHRIWNK